MSEVERRERELAHWTHWQDRADLIWGWGTPAGRARADRRADMFAERGRMTRDSLVLELGCGTGEFSARLAPRVGELIASDLSSELLARCRQRLLDGGIAQNVRFEVQDATALTIADASIDAVFGCSMLHHVDASTALREVVRVLRPAGWCVFSEPNMLNPQIALQKNIASIKRRVGDSPDETAFFPWQIEKLARNAGLVEVDVECFDFLHPLTPPSLLGFVGGFGKAIEKVPLLRLISGSLFLTARKPP